MAENHPKKVCGGFVTSVLSLSDGHEAINDLCSFDVSDSENARYLIISNLEDNKDQDNTKKKRGPKRPRTLNRKRVSLSGTITRASGVYSINNKPHLGVYLQLLHKAIDQLEICIEKWKRVFVIYFGLHQKLYTPKNGVMTKFRKNLARRIERAYSLFQIGYCWVREHEKAESQHYHFALFLDGDKVRHSSIVSEIILDTWGRVEFGNTVRFPENRFYNVVDSKTKDDAIERLSYMAKQRGKGYYRPDQTKDYSTSRLVAR